MVNLCGLFSVLNQYIIEHMVYCLRQIKQISSHGFLTQPSFDPGSIFFNKNEHEGRYYYSNDIVDSNNLHGASVNCLSYFLLNQDYSLYKIGTAGEYLEFIRYFLLQLFHDIGLDYKIILDKPFLITEYRTPKPSYFFLYFPTLLYRTPLIQVLLCLTNGDWIRLFSHGYMIRVQ